jgi:MFS transporter, ACS family, hexuronate transporter
MYIATEDDRLWLPTSADVFNSGELASANGLMGSAAWTGGLLFSLVVGALAATIGYNPVVCLSRWT